MSLGKKTPAEIALN